MKAAFLGWLLYSSSSGSWTLFSTNSFFFSFQYSFWAASLRALVNQGDILQQRNCTETNFKFGQFENKLACRVHKSWSGLDFCWWWINQINPDASCIERTSLGPDSLKQQIWWLILNSLVKLADLWQDDNATSRASIGYWQKVTLGSSSELLSSADLTLPRKCQMMSTLWMGRVASHPSKRASSTSVLPWSRMLLLLVPSKSFDFPLASSPSFLLHMASKSAQKMCIRERLLLISLPYVWQSSAFDLSLNSQLSLLWLIMIRWRKPIALLWLA